MQNRVVRLKVFFYLEFQYPVGFDFSTPEKGNPGIGGTEYATISLASELSKHPDLQVYIISNYWLNLNPKIYQIEARALEEAMALPIVADHYLIFRPKIDPEIEFLKALRITKAKLIAWTHVTPSPKHLRILAASTKVIGVVALGNRQFLSWLDNPVSRKTTVIQNGQYPAVKKSHSHESNIVTYLGALVPQKGFHVLAKAWPEIARRIPELELHVIGGGNLYNDNLEMGNLQIAAPAYENLILKLLGESINSVHFLGKINAYEKAEVIARSYIGIVNPAGYTENCPASALDFESAGVPVVAARKYGLIDTVSHNETGYLIRKDKDLGQTIIDLYQDKLRRQRYATEAANYTRANFSFEIIAKDWSNYLKGGKKFNQIQSRKLPRLVNFTERLALLNYRLFMFLGNRDAWISVVEIKIYLKGLHQKITRKH